MRRPWYRNYLPGWIVTGGGGGGGSGTVQTDGVTIQGDGSSGNKIALLAVQTDATLTGAGIVGNTLKLAPVGGYYPFANKQGGQTNAPENNNVFVVYFFAPIPLSVTKLWINVATADGASSMDVGIYSLAGTRLMHTGSFAPSATGNVGTNVTGGPITLPQGPFLAAATSNSASLNLTLNNNDEVGFINSAYTATGGATLPASITAFSAVNPGQGAFWFAVS